LQQRKLDQGLLQPKASKGDQQTAATLLAQALTEKNVPMAFVTSAYFKAYVAHISDQRFDAPTVWSIVSRLDYLYDRIQSTVARKLNHQAVIAFETDAWTRGGRHFTAICTGAPGLSVFTAAYQNAASDNAVNSADAIHRCVHTCHTMRASFLPSHSNTSPVCHEMCYCD
jgi:hypothetical protein